MLERIKTLVTMCESGIITLDQLLAELRALLGPSFDPMKKGGDL
jgi:hypothetical protein